MCRDMRTLIYLNKPVKMTWTGLDLEWTVEGGLIFVTRITLSVTKKSSSVSSCKFVCYLTTSLRLHTLNSLISSVYQYCRFYKVLVSWV